MCGRPSRPKPAPVVVEQPKVQQEDVETKAAQDEVKTRKRRRFSSLMETGGLGDTSGVSTASTGAVAGKQQLGQ